MDGFTLFSLLVSSLVVYAILVVALGVRRLGRLEDVAPREGDGLPRVSVVVPACNEREKIGDGLRSLLAQDYGNLDIVVIDDRSSDGTGEVVRRLQADWPGLRLFTVSTLPEGWLGKSHALQTGADLADGDYLLFTDADVVMAPSTLRRAMAHMQGADLDHLPLIFSTTGGTPLFDCLVLELGLGLLFAFRPWRVKERGSPFFMGVGAFNLLRRSAYKRIGGHRSFAMYPIDDVMLGKLVKEHGLRQDCLLAQRHVVVPWYATVGEMVEGLEKNGFAFLHYRLWLVPPLVAVLLAGNVLPLWGALFAEGLARLAWAVALAAKLALYAFGLPRLGRSLRFVPGALLTPYLTIYILVRSALVVVRSGGISWRGRFYPLAELKKSRPLFW